MAISKAQQKATAKYQAKTYDQFTLRLKKGERGQIKEFADSLGESVNGLIGRLIREAMEGKAVSEATESLVTEGNAEVVCLPSEIIKTAQEAAVLAREDISQFVTRAINTQAERDQLIRRMKV